MHHVWRQTRDTQLSNSRRFCQNRKVLPKSRKQGSIPKWFFCATVNYQPISPTESKNGTDKTRFNRQLLQWSILSKVEPSTKLSLTWLLTDKSTQPILYLVTSESQLWKPSFSI